MITLPPGSSLPRPGTIEIMVPAGAPVDAWSQALAASAAPSAAEPATDIAGAAQPTLPTDNSTIGPAGTAVLSWSEPAEHVLYFVEVQALDGGPPHEVFAAYVDHSPLQIALDPASHHYAWRIHTVADAGGHYRLGHWSHFAVMSVGSSPDTPPASPANETRAVNYLGAIAIAVLLAGCSAAKPPPLSTAARGVLHPATAAPELRGPSRYLASRWSFSVTENACVARTYRPELNLSVTVGPADTVRLAMEAVASPGPRWRGTGPAEFDFSGAGGEWRVRARIHERTVSASLPPTATGLGDVLTLLGGGQLSARTVDGSLPGLRVPDAGVAGRDWYSCARDRLTSRTVPHLAVPEPESQEQ